MKPPPIPPDVNVPPPILPIILLEKEFVVLFYILSLNAAKDLWY